MTGHHTTRRDLLVGAGGGLALAAAPSHPLRASTGTVRALGAMAIGPDGRLIAGDWRSGALHAMTLPAALRGTTPGAFRTTDLDGILRRAAGLSAAEPLRPTGLVFDAARGLAVVALEVGRGPEPDVRLALVDATGAVEVLDPSTLSRDTLAIADPPGDARIWNRIPARCFLTTDLAVHGSEVLVAGLSGTAFDSTLRRVPYPFRGQVDVTRVEMYHAVHNQIETRAPVRAFAVVDLGGVPHVLAAYTCTPLVTVPLEALRDGARVRGKTIAELGFGNTPLAVIPFSLRYQGQESRWVMVANSAKAADLIAWDALEAANRAPGLNEPVRVPFQQHAGPDTIAAPITGLIRLVDQDAQFFLALRRDAETGAAQLVSIRKGAFFRLSDFVNEYDFPTYDYPPGDAFQQDYVRPFHRLLRTEEGHADLVR